MVLRNIGLTLARVKADPLSLIRFPNRIMFQVISQFFWALYRGGIQGNAHPGKARELPAGFTEVLFLLPHPRTKEITRSFTRVRKLRDRPVLDSLAKEWLEKHLGLQVNFISAQELRSWSSCPSNILLATVMTPTRRDIFWVIHFWRILSLMKTVRRLSLPALIFLPDTCDPEVALITDLLTKKQGGATVFLQSTEEEARKFGYRNPATNVFWTWPSSRISAYEPLTQWKQRANRMVLASSFTDSSRRSLMTSSYQQVHQHFPNWSAKYDGGLSRRAYSQLMSQSKICVTTNTLPPTFVLPFKFYRQKIPAFHTTGRVWEAFAFGCLLVCQQTKNLEELGFLPGVHFVELGPPGEPLCNVTMLTDAEMKKIARNGQERFRSSAKKEPKIKIYPA